MAPNMYTCRICFDTKCEKRVSFDAADTKWEHLFEFCVGMTLVPNSSAPRVLCRSCADKLKDFAQFKTRCLKSEDVWKQTFTKKNICTPKTEDNKRQIEIIIKTENNMLQIESIDHTQKTKEDTPQAEKNVPQKDNNISETYINVQTGGNIPQKDGKIPQKDGNMLQKDGNVPQKDVNMPQKDGNIPQKADNIPQKGSNVAKTQDKDDDDYMPVESLDDFADPDLIFHPANKVHEKADEIDRNPDSIVKNEGEIHPALNACKVIVHIEEESVKRTSKQKDLRTYNTRKAPKYHYLSHAAPVKNTRFSSNKLLSMDLSTLPTIRTVDLIVPTTIPTKPIKFDNSTIKMDQKDDNNTQKVNEPIKVFHNASLSKKYRMLPIRTMSGIIIRSRPEQSSSIYFQSTDVERDLLKKREARDIKPKAENYYCGVCKYECNEVAELKEHWKEHVAKNELNCHQCEYSGRDFADLAAHRYKHHPPEFAHIVFCALCSRQFGLGRRTKLLEFHYRKYHLHKKGGWCATCGVSYSSYRMFAQHEATHVDPAICDHCGRTFKSRAHVERHLKRSSTATEEKHCCDQCGKTFCQLESLRRHVKWHSGEKEKKDLKCSHCDEIFPTSYRLNIHLKAIQGKTYICETCGAVFYCKTYLRNHKEIHDDKKYTCEHCGKKFHWKSNWRSHLKRHAGIRAHKCSVCDKAFLTMNEVKRHQVVHTGLYTVKCLDQHCDRGFANNSKMRRHYNAIHLKQRP